MLLIHGGWVGDSDHTVHSQKYNPRRQKIPGGSDRDMYGSYCGMVILSLVSEIF